jgi:dCMP deaminase
MAVPNRGEKPLERPAWDAYFLAMALIASMRSTCMRRQVGAVVVSDNRILATGYNGSPAGAKHCDGIGCLRQQLGIPSGERLDICRASHAEMNAIAQAASSGTPLNGCSIYVTDEPCAMCSKLLINAGCKRIVYMRPYPDELSRTLRAEVNLKSELYENRDEVLRVLSGAALE